MNKINYKIIKTLQIKIINNNYSLLHYNYLTQNRAILIKYY